MEQSLYKETTERLINHFQLSTRFINKLAEERQISDLISILNINLSKYEKLELILRMEGGDFFAGSKPTTKELRQKIIEKWDVVDRDMAFNIRCNSNGKSEYHKSRKLSALNWHRGGQWAKDFMINSGIDTAFSGKKTIPINYEDYEDVEPYKKLPELKVYQENLKDELKQALAESGDDAKCLISLPTGAGKTRIAVEAYTEYLRPRFYEGKFLIWIAQSEELCEQAIATFQQIWQHKEFTESLRIYRYYGKHELNENTLIGGIVVCSISKIYYAIKKGENVNVNLIIENCGACIIDEAHRAVTQMYETFYKYSQKIRDEKIFPICGLTATPGRNDDINKLTKFFIFKLITPCLPMKYQQTPIDYFRDKGYLARPIHKIITTGETYIITFEGGEANPSLEFLEKEMENRGCKMLAKSVKRNKKILDVLISVKEKQTIVYSCNVEHANLLTAALIVKGIQAAAITAETPRHKRLVYIDKFRKGELQMLVNHSVLTTGFDAPKTNNIVICRPIFSDILYEQIVGRGLRGPKFGGTETCNIIDFSDNLGRFGDQQSYHRFEEFWEKDT